MSMAFHYTWCHLNNSGLQGSQGTDMSTANNAATIAFSEVINMGSLVPPIPCLVWIYKYTGVNGTIPAGVGGLNCTNYGVQLFSEQHHSYIATIAGSELQPVGPFFCEFGAYMSHTGGSTFGNHYVAGIEF